MHIRIVFRRYSPLVGYESGDSSLIVPYFGSSIRSDVARFVTRFLKSRPGRCELISYYLL